MARLLLFVSCAVFVSSLLTGCGTDAAGIRGHYHNADAVLDGQVAYAMLAGPGPMVSMPEATDETEQPEETIRGQQPGEPRLQVYTGRFQLTSTDINASADSLTHAVKALGGYLQSRTDDKLVVRVPSQHFQTLVSRLDEFGAIGSQSIQSEDVTDSYEDLGLRLGVLKASSDRLTALMEKARSIDELLKLEAQLTKLTSEMESLQGQIKRLGNRISYSTLDITFTKRSFTRTNEMSPFAWINRLGPEHVLSSIVAGAEPDEPKGLRRLLPHNPPMDIPVGFLPVLRNRHELQAISPDGARLWYREFKVADNVGQSFWAKAIRTHLIDHRGCEVIDESSLMPDSEQNHDGYYQLLVSAETDRGPLRHLLTLSVKPGLPWSEKAIVRVTEFTAPPELYDNYSDAVGMASLFPIAVFNRPAQNAQPSGSEPMLIGENWTLPPARIADSP